MFRVPTSAFRVGRDSVNQQVDLLAIAAHRDDAELTCGGTLAKVARAGQRVGILDLTQGEMGTRGDAATRAPRAAAWDAPKPIPYTPTEGQHPFTRYTHLAATPGTYTT